MIFPKPRSSFPLDFHVARPHSRGNGEAWKHSLAKWLLNGGMAMAEIAAREGVTEWRMRMFVQEIIEKRAPNPPAEFAALQISRLGYVFARKARNDLPSALSREKCKR